MKKYVIFLRGINTGGLKIKMEELKKTLELPEFKTVTTVLATGNVIIETSLSADETLEKVLVCLSEHWQRPIYGLIRTQEEVENIVQHVAEMPEHNQMVLFSDQSLYEELSELFEASEHDEQEKLMLFEGKDLLWVVKKGMTTKNFGKILASKKYQQFLTSRNMRTIEKIHKKLS
ncbi:hypothetical protein D920_02767 [Enterococcus faecalis 13-SD-W-01]|nr:hypothetical protein D920_02767 [Enterococcus faecalis 13-SD-W-01]